MHLTLFSSIWNRTAGMLLVAAMGALTARPALAQTSFEYVYGGPIAMELGLKGVEPVDGPNACSGGGYIAVGCSRSPSGGANSDAYVVRTNNDGSRRWEFTYDLGGINGNDTAYSVKELTDGSGFIITGSSDQGTMTTDVFLMKIDCDGVVVWETTYGQSDRNEAGFDVAIAPPQTSGNEDFIVCGYANNASGMRDAYLLRTDNVGNLLWDNTYDNGGQVEWFNKVIQAAATTGQAQGDIVAVGSHHNGQGLQGFVVRCNSTNGAITPLLFPNHGAADYGIGNALNEEFFSVTQLPNGDLAFVGYSDAGPIVNGFGTRDIYLARTNGGNPGIVGAQTLTGDNGFANDLGYDIIFTANAMPYTPAGSLVVVGSTTYGGSYDACMVAVNPLTLARRPGTARRYGDIGKQAGDEVGFSVHEVTTDIIGHKAGFIICGTSRSNLGNPSALDPGDLYLVKTSSAGSTTCDSVWFPVSWGYGLDPEVLSPTIRSIFVQVPRNATGTSREWQLSVCAMAGKPESGGASIASAGTTSTVRTFPNPVRSGDIASLTFTPGTAGPVSITISDMSGRSVAVHEVASTGREMVLPIETTGLTPGTYLVTIGAGSRSQSIRIVVQ